MLAILKGYLGVNLLGGGGGYLLGDSSICGVWSIYCWALSAHCAGKVGESSQMTKEPASTVLVPFSPRHTAPS